MKKIFVIHDDTSITSVDIYAEGTGIFMPDDKGVIIHADKAKIKVMLMAAGISDFEILDSFIMET